MDRRAFLRSIATVCGAAVACPGELLKSKTVTPWKAYYNGGCFKTKAEYEEFLKKFKTAFKNTKFKPPGRSRWIMFRGTPIYYQENLSA